MLNIFNTVDDIFICILFRAIIIGILLCYTNSLEFLLFTSNIKHSIEKIVNKHKMVKIILIL